MLRTCWGCILLFVGLLYALPAHAQTTENRESESLKPPPSRNTSVTHTPDLREAAAMILKRTNAFRSAQGRSELQENAKLMQAAQDFADYLARTDRFSHTVDGRQPSERVVAHGYDYCLTAENIAWEEDPSGFSTAGLARSMVHGWKNSPGHRRNMLDPDVMDIGVGVAYSQKSGRYYGVQEFGRPKSAMICFRISNQTDVPARYEVDGKPFTLPPGTTRIHERCRPGELEFQGAGDQKAPDDTPTYHVRNGQRYVIESNGHGAYRLVEAS